VGNWYKNITTLGPRQAEIVTLLARHDRAAYVTPTRNGVTVAYDRESEESGDPSELGDLALTMSQELRCPALAAAVYDDDVLLLALYDAGTEVGEYNSAGSSTLSALSLARLFQVRARAPILWLLLKSPRLPLFLFESFRHRMLIRILKQPVWAFATGYKYIHQGEPPEDVPETDLLHVERGQAVH
jgi:hypothetical protein